MNFAREKSFRSIKALPVLAKDCVCAAKKKVYLSFFLEARVIIIETVPKAMNDIDNIEMLNGIISPPTGGHPKITRAKSSYSKTSGGYSLRSPKPPFQSLGLGTPKSLIVSESEHGETGHVPLLNRDNGISNSYIL